MTRTNIDIDEKLIETVMRRHNLSTKRAAVDFALRRVAGTALTEEVLRTTRGVGWGADLAELRAGDPPPEGW